MANSFRNRWSGKKFMSMYCVVPLSSYLYAIMSRILSTELRTMNFILRTRNNWFDKDNLIYESIAKKYVETPSLVSRYLCIFIEFSSNIPWLSFHFPVFQMLCVCITLNIQRSSTFLHYHIFCTCIQMLYHWVGLMFDDAAERRNRRKRNFEKTLISWIRWIFDRYRHIRYHAFTYTDMIVL